EAQTQPVILSDFPPAREPGTPGPLPRRSADAAWLLRAARRVVVAVEQARITVGRRGARAGAGRRRRRHGAAHLGRAGGIGGAAAGRTGRPLRAPAARWRR